MTWAERIARPFWWMTAKVFRRAPAPKTYTEAEMAEIQKAAYRRGERDAGRAVVRRRIKKGAFVPSRPFLSSLDLQRLAAQQHAEQNAIAQMFAQSQQQAPPQAFGGLGGALLGAFGPQDRAASGLNLPQGGFGHQFR